ncbi:MULTISPECIES: Fic family protein [unclassified Campylobacter]|uniref:Fic family protein n=1 Tax=unclassified Campylobacter TaxID=2593542 RepID=UPI0022E9FA5D|nr:MULTISPECIES: Fic family protein [unclassified Campylobacter]MDA3079205.1 Fic family protein [Campylobacter sp. CS_NA2]MDA3080492.1 Fic family protein [Campylobacter sp. CS_NA1]MDA3085303.1 Fic family protein [Campylobacter sp. CS_ED1]MDA3090080.1 Fic family protein [Campylobacter sp. CS_ED2]WBR51382.1 Fic family protein [Campylobacter sp. CS_NA3]
MSYKPPFTVTTKIINLISEISEKIGALTALNENPLHIKLRKNNRIKTIQASLAIENNSLSIEQITAIIDGKRVLGDPKEIQEVKNALDVYDLLLELNPYEEKDLLKAHRLMMSDLVKTNGKYRTGGVGVFDGKEVVHLAPPSERVANLMADLFKWLKSSDFHPLIKSSVFHYEFEFIHPFDDGNGRIGRLWQTAILKEWKSIFAWLPVESLIKENQAQYYKVLGISDKNADSTQFIEFMLKLILQEIKKQILMQKKVTTKVPVKVTANQQKIIEMIKENPHITQAQLVNIVKISLKSIKENMKKLQENGLIRRIGADKNGHWEVGG